MDTHVATTAMQWEMYGLDTTVAFSATPTDHGFDIRLERDSAPVMSGMAMDTAMLLRVSSALRRQLQHLGYGSQPRPSAVLRGGLCWGPSTPLDASLLHPLFNAA